MKLMECGLPGADQTMRAMNRAVIPGRAKREPGIHTPQPRIWIPGS